MATKGMAVFRANGEDYTINDPNIADEFATNRAYVPGEFVNHEGNLYVFIELHAAGAWNAGHVVLVKLGERYDEMKNALYEKKDLELLNDWNRGHYYADGTGYDTVDIANPGDSANFACMVVPCSPGDVFRYKGESSTGARSIVFLSSASGENNKLQMSGYNYKTEELIAVAPAGSVYMVANRRVGTQCVLQRYQKIRMILSDTDLDDLHDEGYYYCTSTEVRETLLNVPAEVHTGFALNVMLGSAINTSIRIQLITSTTVLDNNTYIGFRIYTPTGGYSRWHEFSIDAYKKALEIKHLTMLEENADLNLLEDVGSYYCPNYSVAVTIKNVPMFTMSSFCIWVVNSNYDNDVSWKRQFFFGNKYGSAVMFTRVQNNAGWGEWEMIITSRSYEQPKIVTASEFPIPAVQSGTVKKTIRIGTSNVAHYWLQGANGINGPSDGNMLAEYPVRIATWRNWLLKAKLDMLFLQECENWLDKENEQGERSVNAFDTLYKPFFDTDTNYVEDGETYSHGTYPDSSARRKILNRLGVDTTSTLVKIKMPYDPTHPDDPQVEQYYNYVIVNISGVGKVFLANIHPTSSASEGRFRNRLYFYSKLAEHINSASSEWDYFIIAGDFNSAITYNGTQDNDYKAIENFCDSVGGHPVNGGVIGWFTTHSVDEVERCLDNIVVSDNIRIDSIESDPVLASGKFIHTDHNPITATISFME